MGLDADEPGIGRRIAEAACLYGLDILDSLFLTPLPGTRLWDKMASADRILANTFPTDWRYYTLTFPVARYKNLSCNDILTEMATCDRTFYSLPRILWRVWDSFWRRRKPLTALFDNLSCRRNFRLARRAHREFGLSYGEPQVAGRRSAPRPQPVIDAGAAVPSAK